MLLVDSGFMREVTKYISSLMSKRVFINKICHSEERSRSVPEALESKV